MKWKAFLSRKRHLKAVSEKQSHRVNLPILPLVVLVLVLFIPIGFADFIAPHTMTEALFTARFQPPVWEEGGSWDFILGTDSIGRDILSRCLYGARVSGMVAGVSIAISATIGILLGMLAGYFGGMVDMVISRLIDLTFSIPSIILALVLAITMGPGMGTILIVVSAILWTRFARIVRGEVLSLRTRAFVELAKVAGVSNTKILVRHILPNLTSTLTVLVSLQVSFVILLEATMSFLGVGLPPPTPSWGLMVADGRAVVTSAWWISFFPGLFIAATVLSFNLLGDWLRDRLDPKLAQV